MSVVVKEVVSRSQLIKWVDFPNKLYKKNKYYVPFLMQDEISTFTKKSNPAYDFCETKLFLAYKNNKIVGRIAGLINHAYNKKWNKNAIRFTRFDFIDDLEVSKALMDKVISWGKENGYNEAMGPIGFHDLDHEGMLVEGFEELNMSITFYNHPYYLTHMEALGFKKDVDWVEYQVFVPEEIDERVVRISKRIMEKNGYKLVIYKKRKTLLEDAHIAFKVIDEAFAKLYGTVPLTEAVATKLIGDYISVVNLKYVYSVKTKDDELVGFGVLVPSIAKALKKSNGRLFPFGIFRLLKALKGKNDTLEMFFIGIKPEYQMKGLTSIILNHALKVLKDNGVKICETGPELETNSEIQSMWKTYNSRQHRRRRCYIRNI